MALGVGWWQEKEQVTSHLKAYAGGHICLWPPAPPPHCGGWEQLLLIPAGQSLPGGGAETSTEGCLWAQT